MRHHGRALSGSGVLSTLAATGRAGAILFIAAVAIIAGVVVWTIRDSGRTDRLTRIIGACRSPEPQRRTTPAPDASPDTNANPPRAVTSTR